MKAADQEAVAGRPSGTERSSACPAPSGSRATDRSGCGTDRRRRASRRSGAGRSRCPACRRCCCASCRRSSSRASGTARRGRSGRAPSPPSAAERTAPRSRRRFSSMLCCWLRPTNPHTALTPSSAAASNTRSMELVLLAADRRIVVQHVVEVAEVGDRRRRVAVDRRLARGARDRGRMAGADRACSPPDRASPPAARPLRDGCSAAESWM